MAEKPRRDDEPPDTRPGTTKEEDFGRTDRYANKDDEAAFNFETTGDDTAWDSGREAAIPHSERPRAADVETPGVSGPRADEATGNRGKKPDSE